MLYIYNLARTVPNEAKKPISAGRLKGFTDINPMWRIKRLTEMFGPCGIGWWYEITDKRIVEDDTTNQKAAFVDILLYYKHPLNGEVSHGIPGTGGSALVAQERNGPYFSDEAFKMALTDAISVASKSLGLGADVYYEKDRSKYNNVPEAPQNPPPQKPAENPEVVVKCEVCGEVIKPYTTVEGVEIDVHRHAKGSVRKYDRIMCLACIEDTESTLNAVKKLRRLLPDENAD